MRSTILFGAIMLISSGCMTMRGDGTMIGTVPGHAHDANTNLAIRAAATNGGFVSTHDQSGNDITASFNGAMSWGGTPITSEHCNPPIDVTGCEQQLRNFRAAQLTAVSGWMEDGTGSPGLKEDVADLKKVSKAMLKQMAKKEAP